MNRRIWKSMNKRRVSRFGAATACCASLAWAMNCGFTTVVHHFELPACPAEQFSFPASASHEHYGFQASSEAWLPCPGWQAYTVHEGSRVVGGGAARLNRGPSCSLDIVWGHGNGRGSTGQDEPAAEQTMPWVEALAKAVMHGSGGAPQLPAAGIERLYSDREKEEWCARRAALGPADTTVREEEWSPSAAGHCAK